MKEIVKLEAYNIEQLVNLSGVKDENLEVLEDHFQVEISLRGDEMSIVGSQQQIEKTKKVIYSLLKLIVSGVSISRRDVIYAQKLVEKDKLDQLSELYHIKIARTYNGKLIYPKTLGQKSYYYALKNNDVVFGIGPAGTGKTYLAVVFAVAALKNNEVKKISNIPVFATLVSSIIIGLCGVGLVEIKILDTPKMLIVGSIMPLLPGVPFIKAIRDLVSGELMSGVGRAIDAGIIATAIAVGVGIAMNIYVRFGGVL